MIIKNRQALARGMFRRHALDIVETGIAAVMPASIMKMALGYDATGRTIRICGQGFEIGGRLFVIGGGKASGAMAEALENIVGPENITAGVVNCKEGSYGTRKIKIVAAGHPLPDENGVQGVKEMLALKEDYAITQDDLVLCLISGGGSALMPYPVEGVSLADRQEAIRLLLGSGADIKEINTVRKHLSRIKGGQLGQYFAPTRVVSLIISDVVGNDISVIASGPTTADPSTFKEALDTLARYGLLERIPLSAVDYLARGCRGEVPETTKALGNCHNCIIGDNRMALEAMQRRAVALGYKPCILSLEQTGDANRVAWERAREIMQSEADCDVFIIGGETTLKLPRDAGRGGRNQHYAAVSLLAMKDYPGDWLVAAVGSDGADYIPGVAGAIVDNQTWREARRKQLDISSYLARYDSNALLNEIGNSLLLTEDTGTNVGDLILYMLKRDRIKGEAP